LAKENPAGPARAFAKSQAHPPNCRLVFGLFVLVRFWALLGKGSSKTPSNKNIPKSNI
jgi:hypothetical protein